MANSYAQPILRTADPAEAMGVVTRLLELADTSQLEVDFDARVFSAGTLEPLMELLPDADWWSERPGYASSGRGECPPDHLPIRLQSWGLPPETVGPLLAAVGESPATLRWDFSGWPEAPEVGLGVGGSRGSYVTMCVNARDLDLDEPAVEHTVFVHVKQIEAERAAWLAAQVGRAVIGDLVMAPL